MIKLSNPVKGILFSFLASLLVSFDGRAESAIPPEIPLRDFFRNPERAAYQLSPSGASIAFLRLNRLIRCILTAPILLR